MSRCQTVAEGEQRQLFGQEFEDAGIYAARQTRHNNINVGHLGYRYRVTSLKSYFICI